MMNEEVRSIMTKNPPTVAPETTIEEASKILLKTKVHHLPVVEGKILVGLVTTYDLWKLEKAHASTRDMKVKDVMSTNVIKIIPKDKVGTAAELFMDKRFHGLPVVNLRGELKGVVTSLDVMRYMLKKEYPTPILYADEIERDE